MQEVFKKIIDELEDYIKDTAAIYNTNQNYNGAGGFNKAVKIVEQAAKEYNNGWIPCEERLPKPREKVYGNKQQRVEVLVTLKNSVVKEMLFEFQSGEFWETGDENPISHWQQDVNGPEYEVIAWQPLPEPYRKEV